LVVCVFGLVVQALREVPFLKLGFFCVEKLVWISKFLNALILAQSHPDLADKIAQKQLLLW